MSAPPDTTLSCDWVASPNFGPRRPITDPQRQPDMIVLHYTAMVSCERALHWLTREDSQVSSHYLVDCDGSITQMVREADRAWHAGAASWQGDPDINSASIGIEIHNEGPASDAPDFPDAQIDSIIALCKDIIARHSIAANRVLAHSDVSIARKNDPGPYFPWERLAAAGVGLFPEPGQTIADTAPDVAATQRQLADIGYSVEATGVADEQSTAALRAFQLHWRRRCCDGAGDAETRARIASVAALVRS